MVQNSIPSLLITVVWILLEEKGKEKREKKRKKKKRGVGGLAAISEKVSKSIL